MAMAFPANVSGAVNPLIISIVKQELSRINHAYSRNPYY